MSIEFRWLRRNPETTTPGEFFVVMVRSVEGLRVVQFPAVLQFRLQGAEDWHAVEVVNDFEVSDV